MLRFPAWRNAGPPHPADDSGGREQWRAAAALARGGAGRRNSRGGPPDPAGAAAAIRPGPRKNRRRAIKATAASFNDIAGGAMRGWGRLTRMRSSEGHVRAGPRSESLARVATRG
eukprot:2035543-Alexandrium_andersonii.AAC.1